MSLTKHQIRMRSFKSKDDWKRWGLSVLAGSRGMLVMNLYEQRQGSLDLRKALRYLVEDGLVRTYGPPKARVYESVADPQER